MNKKITAIASASVIALATAHAAYWVYQSDKIKASIEVAAGQISKELGRKKSEFFYSSSKVTGYPFSLTVDINQPKFISTGGGEKTEISSADEPLVVVSNLIGSGYKVKLPTKIAVKRVADDVESNYNIEFANGSPQMEAKFAGNLMLGAGNTSSLLSYLGDNLKSFRYSDAGYTIKSAADGEVIASSDSDVINITKSRGKTHSVSTAYDIKLNNISGAALFSKKGSDNPAQTGFWPVSVALDASTIDTKDADGASSSVDFIIRNVDVKAASFGFGAKGNVKADGSDIFPFGDMSVKISNYQKMVDYFHGTVSDAMAGSNIPLFRIKSEKSIDFKKVLYDISSEKSNENKDVLLTLSREAGKSLFIGQKGLMEVVDLLKASAIEGATPPSRQEALSPEDVLPPLAGGIPDDDVINAAPAAGEAN